MLADPSSMETLFDPLARNALVAGLRAVTIVTGVFPIVRRKDESVHGHCA